MKPQKQYQIRYQSEMLGTRALYDTYSSLEAATAALVEFKANAYANGCNKLAKSAEIC